ncbi:MAG: PAS domain S-box protein [Deltaproteobacteria bacterium]|nr:PAS domain S-box protein [Deltaproteobacteria bacterium]
MSTPVPFRGKGAGCAAEPSTREIPFDAVSRIARICALGLALEELIGEVCREVLALSGAESVWIVSIPADAPSPPDVWSSALTAEGTDLAEAFRPGPAWEAVVDRLRSAGPCVVPDLSRLSPDDPVRALYEPYSVRSVFLAPLKFGTRLLGVLALHAVNRPRAWETASVSLVEKIVAPVIGAALDRRKMEERLRASEARYRFLAENALDFISLHDPDGKYLYASPAASRMLGYRAEAMTGVPITAFLHPDDRDRVLEENGRLVAGTVSAVTLQYRLRRKDGSYAEVETISSGVTDKRGAIRQVLRITRDVTERKRMETRFFESQKLETIGMLAGGVAHEFNNLLVGINGAAEMLALLLAGNAEAGKYLAMIERSGARAVELTRQLLAYARRGQYRPRVLRLSRAVVEDLPLLKAALPAAVELKLDVDEAAPPVAADIAQLKQVVMSLCLNAAEAMPDGGVLTISVRRDEGPAGGGEDSVKAVGGGFERRVRSGGPLPGPLAVLEVVDAGCGMDEKTIARIFEPFYSTKFVGRGMGLAAVRGIVETHDGVIRVFSEARKGTRVSIGFPAAREAAAEELPPEPSAAPRSGAVLVADDEEDVRAMTRAMLESFGHRVIEARDGAEAVAIFKDRHAEIDLVLLDLMMPRMTGEEAFAEMRRIAPSVRGLLASGYDESGRVREIEAKGFGGFLQKPFRRRDLGRKVGELLAEGGRGASPGAE